MDHLAKVGASDSDFVNCFTQWDVARYSWMVDRRHPVPMGCCVRMDSGGIQNSWVPKSFCSPTQVPVQYWYVYGGTLINALGVLLHVGQNFHYIMCSRGWVGGVLLSCRVRADIYI